MAFKNSYSAIERAIHKLAFATPRLQLDFAEQEDHAFRKRIGASTVPAAPVFVTALPRAGTTLLLNILAAAPQFASHNYRDMPFLLLPLSWNTLSRSFRQADALRERAHADGVMVSVDSPEAFEEMLWMAYWERHYSPDRIRPWNRSDRNVDFLAFFKTHMLKIAELRRPGAGARYVSKNNVNVARLGWLAANFSDATIIVLYREPTQHAASLLRQHRRFSEMHASEPFTCAYMKGLGHFDFGANLRPIDFDGWLDHSPYRDPFRIEFWLAYWIAAYQQIRGTVNTQIIFLGYDSFCGLPDQQLAYLARRLGLPDGTLTRGDVKKRNDRLVDLDGVDKHLIEEARALFAELEALRTQS
ncbi:MAG: sulfotransferase [Beijerinckiaceae bacterium]|nr:sulfotransferase [Beijerinckiaceae bacterium]